MIATDVSPAPVRAPGPRAVEREHGDRLPLVALVLLGAAGFVSVTTEMLPAGLLPQISADLGVRESRAGLLNALYAGIIVLTVLPVMAATARVPRRAMLVAALSVFALSNVLLAVSPEFWMALVARLVGGIAHGTVWALLAPYVARIVPARRLGVGMAIVFGGANLGAAAGAPLGTLLGGIVGWRGAILALAGLVVALVVAVLIVVPRVAGTSVGERGSTLDALRRPGVAPIAASFSLLFVAHFALLTYIAPFLLDAGAGEAVVSLGLSIMGTAGIAGVVLAGRLGDTLPRRSVLVAAGGLVTALLALAVLGTSVVVALALVALWGASISAVIVLNQAAGLAAAGPLKDAVSTLLVLTTQGGIAVGAVYGGLALDAGGIGAVPVAAAVPAVVALGIVVVARRSAYPPGPAEVARRAAA